MIPLESPWLANVLYLCLVLGIWTAAMGVATPGTGVLEAFSLLFLSVAAVGMFLWPVNELAFIPLVLGGAAMIGSVLQPRRASWWLLASAVLISLGSTFLYQAPGGGPGVDLFLAVTMTALTILFFWFGVRRGIEVQRAVKTVGPSTVIGQVGEARSQIHRNGTVYVAGELWSARSEAQIAQGESVRVRDVDGLVLVVEPAESS